MKFYTLELQPFFDGMEPEDTDVEYDFIVKEYKVKNINELHMLHREGFLTLKQNICFT